jgi:hypothetical protein
MHVAKVRIGRTSSAVPRLLVLSCLAVRHRLHSLLLVAQVGEAAPHPFVHTAIATSTNPNAATPPCTTTSQIGSGRFFQW